MPECGCTYDVLGDLNLCPSCAAMVSTDITESLRRAVREGGGACIRCCRERATAFGLLGSSAMPVKPRYASSRRRNLTTYRGLKAPTKGRTR